jgi:hypothetical protein
MNTDVRGPPGGVRVPATGTRMHALIPNAVGSCHPWVVKTLAEEFGLGEPMALSA